MMAPPSLLLLLLLPPREAGWLHLLTAAAAAAALCVWGAEGKVYYSCGAEFNSVERGLILSPGFPSNYSSGMHCIWQFLIPARTYLMLEIFDFDVFESTSEHQNARNDFLPLPKDAKEVISPIEENSNLSTVLPTKGSVLQDFQAKGLDRFSEATPQKPESEQDQPTEPTDLANTLPRVLPVKEAANVTLLRQNLDGLEKGKMPKDKILFAELTARGRIEETEGSPKHFGKVASEEDGTISITALSTDTSSTQKSSADICALDVLYVSDLTTFSSRFCGQHSPLNKNMAFGSSLRMVEVIVELITATDRGRGFAMLFEYKNDTERIAMEGSNGGKGNVTMMLVIAGICFFTLVLLSMVCIACKQKLCPKRGSLDVHGDQQTGIQNTGVDINELRLVMPSQENENNNHSVAGHRMVLSSNGSMECSPLQTDPDVPSAMATESGSDEVFIISAGPDMGGLSFTSYRIQQSSDQDKNLKRSITSPGSVFDWLAERTDPGRGTVGSRAVHTDNHGPRQRTWSARTFRDLLAPFPQLQKKWCSWTTNSPFTKLVNSNGFSASSNQAASTRKGTSVAEIEGFSELAYSGSSASTASYPLTHSAQKQRKLSSCNLKRSRFGNPDFGFLTSSPSCNRLKFSDHSMHSDLRSTVNSQSQEIKDPPKGPIQQKSSLTSGTKSKEFFLETDKMKPTFMISEEGDEHQPLVFAEHVNPSADGLSEANAVLYNLGMASVDERPLDLTSQGTGPAESNKIRTDFDLWGQYPTSYKDLLRGAYKEHSYGPGQNTDATNAHQNFDSLASHTLCQTSVQ